MYCNGANGSIEIVSYIVYILFPSANSSIFWAPWGFFFFLVPWKFKEQNLKLNSVLFFQNYQRDSDSHWLLSGLIIDLERCQSIRELVAERWLINISLKKIDLYTGCASHTSKELKNTDLEHYFSVCSPQESSIKDHLETCYKYRFLSLFQMY